VPISAALSQGPHIKDAAVASRRQRAGDLIGSGMNSTSSATEADVFPLVPSGQSKKKTNKAN